MFDLEKYRRVLGTQWLGQRVKYFEELDSTNSYMKQLPADAITHGQLCLADYQTKGRGQYERNWETAPAKNLTFTIAFRPAIIERFHVLTLACARATVAEIEDTIDCKAFIKWPNDLMVGDKKVGGLLAETMFNGNSLDRFLIGIGLNINQEKFSDELRQKATSLKQLSGKEIEREPFLNRLLSRIEYVYVRWYKRNDRLVKSINQKIIGYGKWIRVQVNGREYPSQYKLLGINQQGQLTAVSKEGDLETFSYEQIRLITD